MDHLRHMAIFKQIVDNGSISAAADKLSLSKSVVSHHLKSLELAVGVQLLHRTTRKQQLTPAGKDFYQRCGELASISNLAWQQARESADKLAGPIKISSPHALVDSFIAPTIGKLCQGNLMIRPSIQVQDRRIDLLGQDIDLAVRVGKLTSSSLMQRKVGEFRDVLCASPTFITQYQQQIAAEQWQELDYIANSWQGQSIQHQLQAKANKPGSALTLSFSANRFADTSSAVLSLAKAGLGVALLPDFVFKQQPSLIELIPSHQCPLNSVYAVHDFGRTPPLLIKKTIDVLIESFQLQA
ncbi:MULTISPECIES: LysR family transcriptional regulator [unclassified Shewanella]|uniref:LysR family transcriptional regulator n=1 Tax=unclassified Shewanella TaxID=196818 RepID=UPI001BC3AA8F|nr:MULTISPECIES: LysR family transcriptional regulator [unclassified Shewanella]GIU16427.1 transcriptional regulator [Shewanella sp. MBTL60-112-B1]GIU36841.1 transcriptional regulator [Shewanella sp. MBTL60-112-B2]